MTEILCRWLNSELDLSQKVDPKDFAEKLATGYLIGEVLKKHQLQNDFESFSQNRTADSKLNNFTRLEPTLHLLEVPFDTNTARDIMTEKPGVATRLMYQLYIALNNKTKADLTGVAMETMRPRAPVKLESMERGPYKERLKVLTPRQTDLNLDQLVEKFRERKRQHLDVEFRTKFEMEEQQRQWQQEMRQQELEKATQARRARTELTARIKAATVEMPKPPPNKTLKAIAFRKELTKKKEAEETQKHIAAFEQQLSRSLADTEEDKEADEEVAAYLNQKPSAEKPTTEMIQTAKPAVNDEYIGKIRKRLQEDAVARKEREKRRRKVLVDQLQAHETLEEARREELLVTRLMRQSQQERRIATQLLQVRHEKAVIQQNRILREQQYEERRQKDFHEALDREAELARLAKLEYIEQTKRDKEVHDKIAQERAEAKYRKHYNTCYDILMDIIDFSCKVGKYRELTAKQLPPKLMREWKLLFTSGKPLYEAIEQPQTEDSIVPVEDSVTEAERQTILDEGDFMEYKNMVGEWQPPEDCEINGPPGNNAVLGHVLARLFSIVSPPTPPPDAPEMPAFPVKACFLGKAFSGKTTVANKIAQEHGLAVLDVDVLVREAIDAHKAGEVVDMPDPTPPEAPLATESAPVTDGDAPASKPKVTISLDNIPPAGPTQDGKDVPVEVTAQDNVKVMPPTSDLLNAGKAEDNKEKADDEKSVSSKVTDLDDADAKSLKKGKTKSAKGNATPRAKLGKLASRFVRKGQAIKDELLVDIMVEAVKRVRDQQGWIMDGFPTTIAQAKLLEKALTGYDANAKPSKEKLKKSRLAPDPQPPKDSPPPVSGIDVVVLFDVPDELAMRRAAGRTHGSNTGEEFQQEFKPPPEGSATGVGKQERVLPAKDAAHDQEQIQHR